MDKPVIANERISSFVRGMKKLQKAFYVLGYSKERPGKMTGEARWR